MEFVDRYQQLLDQLQALRRNSPGEVTPAEEQVLSHMRRLWPLLVDHHAALQHTARVGVEERFVA